MIYLFFALFIFSNNIYIYTSFSVVTWNVEQKVIKNYFKVFWILIMLYYDKAFFSAVISRNVIKLFV